MHPPHGWFSQLGATLLLSLLAACSTNRHDAEAAQQSRSSFDNPSGTTHAGAGSSSQNGGPGVAGCTMPGATRSCCGTGTQTCSGVAEFATWGACLDRNAKPLSCPGTCEQDEFGRCKPDAGTNLDAGLRCGQAEFSPACDAGMPTLCSDQKVNNEPEILAAYAPASGHAVGNDGQIKVWITDEAAAIIAPNEAIDPSSGLITTPGDRAAKAPDGYLWEPALYIAPDTVEHGGQPHFPQYIRGWYNNQPPTNGKKPGKGTGTSGVEIEPAPGGTRLSERFNSEYIWDVSALGLRPGVYSAEFIIADGDLDRAVGCVTIEITP